GANYPAETSPRVEEIFFCAGGRLIIGYAAAVILMDEQPITMSPIEFEQQVKTLLDVLGADLNSFCSTHREQLTGSDGNYEIDVSVRFNAMSVNFLVLVECKHQKAPVKRDIVQILHARMQSTGAQ